MLGNSFFFSENKNGWLWNSSLCSFWYYCLDLSVFSLKTCLLELWLFWHSLLASPGVSPFIPFFLMMAYEYWMHQKDYFVTFNHGATAYPSIIVIFAVWDVFYFPVLYVFLSSKFPAVAMLAMSSISASVLMRCFLWVSSNKALTSLVRQCLGLLWKGKMGKKRKFCGSV